VQRIFILLIVVRLLFGQSELFGQCTVTASIPNDTVTCGDCIQLSAFGRGQGAQVFSENFNSGAASGWATSVQATFTNPCSPNGVDGTTHVWMGNTAPVPRILRTLPYNFTAATSGATICFDMLFATQGNAAPCEGPDEPQEGVYLQYSTNGGTTWTTINYFDPNGGNDPQLVNWNNWCFQLPAGALTNNVSIRWFQDADSGADYDHWGIDNVQIYFNDPSYTISVSSGGSSIYSFPQGSAGGVVPTAVCPIVTRTYNVVMQNTSGNTCSTSVTVNVRNPIVTVDAGQDVTICQGQCTTLNATTKVVKSPAKTPTYRNIQPDTAAVQSIGGIITQGATVNINVRNLNMPTVQSNSIVSVCIDRILANTPFINATDLVFYLICPDSTVIILKPSGQGTGSGGFIGYSTLFNNTCFVPAGPALGTGTAPYSGSFGTNQPFNNLVGCTANGVWKLAIAPNGFISAGNIVTTGWSITFNDPEISYQSDFTWSPTSNMTGSTTLTPNVCPPSTQTYTITASDTAGCITVSDNVTVTVAPICCNLHYTAAPVQPSCGQSNGSINLNIVSGSGAGNYTFLWSNNATTQNLSNLAAGTYRVTITDNGQANCVKDTVIILNSSSNISIQLTNPVNPTCGANNGSITATLSGGTAPYTITIDNGVTQQTQTSPIAGTLPISNLPAATYTVTVVDAQGCQQTAQQTLTIAGGPSITSVTPTAEICLGQNNGTITLVASGTATPLTYLWSNNATTQNLSNLAPGTYTVTVRDANNCTVTGSATVNAGPQCCNLSFAATSTNPLCGASDGSITLNVLTGSGNYTFSWSNAATTQNLNNIPAGNYNVTVTDVTQNCTRDTSINLSSANAPVINAITPTDETCAGNGDGTITLNVTGGTGTLTYLWSNAATTQNIAGLAPANYSVTVSDAAGCIATANATVNAGPVCCTLSGSVSIQQPDCFNPGGSITINLDTTSGTSPFQYSIDGGQNYSSSNTFNTVASGNYNVIGRDANSCVFTQQVNIVTVTQVAVNLGADQFLCAGDNTVIDAGNSGSVYLWSNGDTSQTLFVDTAGTFSVTVTDANGCIGTDDITIGYAEVFVDAGQDTTVLETESAPLFATASGNTTSGSYTWTPSQYLSCTNCQNPVVSPLQTTTYTVRYSDNNGCTATDTVRIEFEPGEYYLYMPNAFTPNGDGNNDIVAPIFKGAQKLTFRIWDRWGELVFECETQNCAWNGSFNGKPLDPGVFIWEAVVKYKRPSVVRYTGSITLIR
jgi:gliding motility-associated-like protein